jgi:hypothetical protein
MIRTSLFITLSLIGLWATAQVQTQIIGDSVRIHSNSGTAELNLENSTDTVLGFLYNKGGGRTRFKRGLIRINDSLYIIGADTLHLNNAGGAAAGKNVYYVSQKYTGTARAVVSGNTLASVSSTNSSYTAQLAKATPGSMVYSYPDPFSARNAALDAIAAGAIPSAEIVILPGSKYTIGSDDSTKNGSIDGSSPNNGTIADIEFPSSVLLADTSVASVLKNKVTTYFGEESSFTYINSSYGIYCFYQNDSLNTNYRSAVYGKGSFYQVYGEVNKFTAGFGFIGNRNSYTEFHAREIYMQQWRGIVFSDYATCSVDIDNVSSADANVFTMGYKGFSSPSTGSTSNSPRMLSIKVQSLRFGRSQIPYPSKNDYWYLLSTANNLPVEGTLVNIDIANLFMQSTNNGSLFYIAGGSSDYNVHMTVNIGNLIQRDEMIGYATENGGLIYAYGPSIAINNSITFNIKSADIDAPLLGMENFGSNAANFNNRLNLNVGDLQKNRTAFKGGIFNVTSMLSQTQGEPLLINVHGNFRSYDSAALIYITNIWYSYPFANRYQFSGKYESLVHNIPVVHFYANPGKNIALTDATLINDGITPCIYADSVTGSTDCNSCQNAGPITAPIYIKNVHANSAPGNNIQVFGEAVKVYADLSSFFN